MDEITFGEVIRSIRKAKGMTQEEVAEGICSTSSLSKMENGSQVPSRQRFQKIMERLGSPAILMPIFSAAERRRENSTAGKHWRHWRAEEWSVPRNFCCGGKRTRIRRRVSWNGSSGRRRNFCGGRITRRRGRGIGKDAWNYFQ